MSLTGALKLRRSTREYSDRALSTQTMSDLLWAAFGINRPNGERTAPYWRHVMVIDIYLAKADDVWLYEPKTHSLMAHLSDDIRANGGLPADEQLKSGDGTSGKRASVLPFRSHAGAV
jgi:hypothetical protein